jgi:nudix-type nucleoside diphosphatase (YffH/AdpP family)
MNDHRIKIQSTTTLLEGWSKVIRVVYRLLRRDGSWQDQDRDLLDRGDGVTILLCDRAHRKVLLLKQPRVIATLRGASSSQTIEACNGQVEDESPLECALREVEQETGHRLATLQPVMDVYASPGASLEIVHLFLGEYSDATKVSESGGLIEEGEDIELMEVDIDLAMRWIDEKIICDARTILTMQFAVLHNYFSS